MGSTGSFVAAPRGREWGPGPIVRGTRIWRPGQAETFLFVSSPYSSDFFSSKFGGRGCLGKRVAETPLPLFPYGNWDRAGPEDETEGCPRSQSAIRHPK